MRTRPPDCSTDPSTTASTFNSLAICGSGLLLALYVMADVREITRKASIFARVLMSSSVIPSVKYSCAGSFDGLRSGRTTSEFIRRGPGCDVNQNQPQTSASVMVPEMIHHVQCIGLSAT